MFSKEGDVCELSTVNDIRPGQPPNVSYYASVIKIYNSLGNLIRFEIKNMFCYVEKNALDYYNAGVVILNIYFVCIWES
jgi:hypothetical protein